MQHETEDDQDDLTPSEPTPRTPAPKDDADITTPSRIVRRPAFLPSMDLPARRSDRTSDPFVASDTSQVGSRSGLFGQSRADAFGQSHIGRFVSTVESNVIKAQLPFSLANLIYLLHFAAGLAVAFVLGSGQVARGAALVAVLVAVVGGEAWLWRRSYATTRPRAWKIARTVVGYTVAAALVGMLGGFSGGVIWGALFAPVTAAPIVTRATPVINARVIEPRLNGSGVARGMAFDPDGTAVALSSSVGVAVFDLKTNLVSRSFVASVAPGSLVQTLAIAWSADGTRLAAAYRYQVLASAPARYELTIWRAADGSVALTTALSAAPLQLAWSADDATLACALASSTGGGFGPLLRWHVATGAELPPLFVTLTAGATDGQLFAWSTDPNYLALLAGPTTIHIVANDTGAVAQTLTDDVPITMLAWSDDGRLLAVGQRNNSVAFYDLHRLVALGTVALPAGQPLTQIAWAPGGQQLLAVVGPRIMVIDVPTLQVMHVLDRPTATPTPVPAATSIPTATPKAHAPAKPLARVTPTTTTTPPPTVASAAVAIVAALWSPDSRSICALYADGQLALWSFGG